MCVVAVDGFNIDVLYGLLHRWGYAPYTTDEGFRRSLLQHTMEKWFSFPHAAQVFPLVGQAWSRWGSLPQLGQGLEVLVDFGCLSFVCLVTRLRVTLCSFANL